MIDMKIAKQEARDNYESWGHWFLEAYTDDELAELAAHNSKNTGEFINYMCDMGNGLNDAIDHSAPEVF